MFASRSLTEDEIESSGDYKNIFLTPDSDMWDPYDESYKLNEDSFLDSRGNIEIPSIPVQHTLVADADMSAASAGIVDNDMAASAIEKVNQPRVTGREVWAKPREVSEIDLVLDTSLVENPTGSVSTSKYMDN